MYQINLQKLLPIRVSVIIPTLNEEDNIDTVVEWLRVYDERLEEIIVVDGGSTDNTINILQGLSVKLVESKSSRAIQMNAGAKVASGNVLYFVHADTRPPRSYIDDIENSIVQGYLYGCYRSEFFPTTMGMRMNAFFTRFNCLMFRGGDQSLFVVKLFFKYTDGFDEGRRIMEEYAWFQKAKKIGNLKIIPKGCLISMRKYDKNSYFRINLVNLYVFCLFYLGFPSERIAKTYKKLLN
tara:strand:+ start:2210 stop:2923 length:714 start_codon:yes stop_codon:yes gene_type:complete